jgi:hypothetical protein
MSQLQLSSKGKPSRISRSISQRRDLVKRFLSLPVSLQNKRKFTNDHDLPESTFKTWLKYFSEEDLNSPDLNPAKIRNRAGKYDAVSEGLVKYIELRRKLFNTDGLGLSWALLKDRAIKIGEKCLDPNDFQNFKASDGYFEKVLKANDLIGVNLHGEANEIDEETAEDEMRKFRVDLKTLMEEHDIGPERVFNADQTGLFYLKLPNKMYCIVAERKTIKGVKQMRDKNRVTAMVCTSAAGAKVPLALVG